MAENREMRVKRLKLRSWRRGTREMDLFLGTFADEGIEELTDAELDAHEVLMTQSDQDLMVWLTGQKQVPNAQKDAFYRVKCYFLSKKIP